MVDRASDTDDALLPYGELLRIRASLKRGESPLDDYTKFAASVISPEDVTLLRSLIHNLDSGNLAGSVALVTYTRGGVGDLSYEIRHWLNRDGNNDTEILTSGPLVLAQTVRNLLDGTALRCLFEFADQYDARIELNHLLNEMSQEYISTLLRSTRERQIESLLASAGDAPSDRVLWALRTYVSSEPVRRYLHRFAVAGRVASIVSLAVAGNLLDWRLFDLAKAGGPFEQRCLINSALDNIARGADPRGLTMSAYYRSLSPAERSEIEQGLEILKRGLT